MAPAQDFESHKIAEESLEVGTKVVLKELKEFSKENPNYHSVMKVIKVNEDMSYDLEDGAKNKVLGRTIDQVKVLPVDDKILEDIYLVEDIVSDARSEGVVWFEVNLQGWKRQNGNLRLIFLVI